MAKSKKLLVVLFANPKEATKLAKQYAREISQYAQDACSDLASCMAEEEGYSRAQLDSGSAADDVYNKDDAMQDLCGDSISSVASAMCRKLGLDVKKYHDAAFNLILDQLKPMMGHVNLEPLRHQ